jgi:hypothetical protein
MTDWTTRLDPAPVASINVETQGNSVSVRYRRRSYGSDWSDVEQCITIQWPPCRFGGERPWFRCPVASNGAYCGRRVTKLYGAGRLFACVGPTPQRTSASAQANLISWSMLAGCPSRSSWMATRRFARTAIEKAKRGEYFEWDRFLRFLTFRELGSGDSLCGTVQQAADTSNILAPQTSISLAS